jgi:ligand-binding sensor domain-containing protein
MGCRSLIPYWLLFLLSWAGEFAGHAAPRRTEFFTKAGNWLVQTWESEDGLPENSATAMVQTPDHYLWFGTFNGLVRFDGVRFTVFDTSNTPELPSSGIVNLHLDGAGRLWVSTTKGLVWREGNRWDAPPGVKPNVQDFIRTFAENSSGEVLLTTFGGKIFEFAHGALREMPVPPGQANQGYLGVADDDGRWWVVPGRFVLRADS